MSRAVSAQTRGPGRLEVSVGAGWIGPIDMGSATAAETTPSLGTLPIFNTTTTLGGAPAAAARVGWRLSRAFSAEAEASVARPELRVAIANDIENAPSATVAERVAQFTVGGALAWHLPFGSARLDPFAIGGAGYLRQLHETATYVQTGRYYAYGGGVVIALATRARSRLDMIGIRVDVRAITRVDGVAFDSAARTSPSALGSLFLRLR